MGAVRIVKYKEENCPNKKNIDDFAIKKHKLLYDARYFNIGFNVV